MGAINETELKRQLSQGQLSSLYVVRGEEKYLVSRWARRILKAAGGDSFPEFNRNELGSSATVDAIADAAEALPFSAATSASPSPTGTRSCRTPPSSPSSRSCWKTCRRPPPWCSGTPPKSPTEGRPR